MTAAPAPPRDPVDLRAVRAGQRRARRWRVLVFLVPAALVVAALGWAVWSSPLLAVQRVVVQGSTALPHDRVREATQVRVGTPLVRVDTEAVAERVRALPGVATVEVRRGLPHELVVVVVDRVAVAVMRDGDRWVTVDASGAPIIPVAAPGILPVVRAGSDPLRSTAAQVAAGLPPVFARRVEVITARTTDDVVLVMRDGRRVRWGSAERGDRKAAVVDALLRQPGRIYDVSAPDYPAVIP